MRRQLVRVAGGVLVAAVVWGAVPAWDAAARAAPVWADELLAAELQATPVVARTASPIAGTAPAAALSLGPGRNVPSLGAPLGVGQVTPAPSGAAATATVSAALQLTAAALRLTPPPSAPATLTVPPTVPAVATPTLVATTTVTPAATPIPTATLLPSPTPIPDPLASTRTVLTTAPIAIGDETLAPGAPLEIPLDTPLADGTVPSGTTIRLPGGQVLTLPAGTRIPAVENPTTVGEALTTVLQRTSVVGDTTYAPGTAIVVPPGTSVLGALEPNATVLLPPGTAVQVGGRTQTVREPLAATVSGAPVGRPATLPSTGDAAPVWWPAGLGLLMVLVGWRLRRVG